MKCNVCMSQKINMILVVSLYLLLLLFYFFTFVLTLQQKKKKKNIQTEVAAQNGSVPSKSSMPQTSSNQFIFMLHFSQVNTHETITLDGFRVKSEIGFISFMRLSLGMYSITGTQNEFLLNVCDIISCVVQM